MPEDDQPSQISSNGKLILIFLFGVIILHDNSQLDYLPWFSMSE